MVNVKVKKMTWHRENENLTEQQVRSRFGGGKDNIVGEKWYADLEPGREHKVADPVRQHLSKAAVLSHAIYYLRGKPRKEGETDPSSSNHSLIRVLGDLERQGHVDVHEIPLAQEDPKRNVITALAVKLKKPLPEADHD